MQSTAPAIVNPSVRLSVTRWHCVKQNNSCYNRTVFTVG